MNYTIRKASDRITLNGVWEDPAWAHAESLDVNCFHARSSDHRPVTRARLLWEAEGLHVFFRVEDRFVRCVMSEYQQMVSGDSCIEFFIQPKAEAGYLNFEINSGGTLLLYYIEDSTPAPGGFKKWRPVEAATASSIKIHHSLPQKIEEEIQSPVTWTIQAFVPWSVFEQYVGKLPPISGSTWKANFYKCGDKTSHPHWASWAPIGEKLSFHQTEFFAPITFGI